MWTTIAKSFKNHHNLWFLCSVLLFVNLYSFSTLTTKPGFWYDEAINVELAHNFAESGRLDIVIAPNTFSGKGATVGSTGYPITVPLAGFFQIFGFGLTQARVYMLLWMSACIVAFFVLARKLWGNLVAYVGTLLIATFAPFYGNGRSVMGEIPGFLFFVCSFFLFERKRFFSSGMLLGLAVVSKPSVFIFLIPAYVVAACLLNEEWKHKLSHVLTLGLGSISALIPWFFIYIKEITRGGLAENILNHFKNPYAEAGISVFSNISQNFSSLFTSTTLLYMWLMVGLVGVALFLKKTLLAEYRNLFTIALVYLPLALLQYLKSFGYLRYLIAFELIIFILFLISLPVVASFFIQRYPKFPFIFKVTPLILSFLLLVQTAHLFWFSNIYPSEKTQKTIAFLSEKYPDEVIGVIDVPQVASLLPANRKYQYLSTYGLWDFGVNPLRLSKELMPKVLVAHEEDSVLSALYEKDLAFSDGFLVYKKR